jgi:hypothetical protein
VGARGILRRIDAQNLSPTLIEEHDAVNAR